MKFANIIISIIAFSLYSINTYAIISDSVIIENKDVLAANLNAVVPSLPFFTTETDMYPLTHSLERKTLWSSSDLSYSMDSNYRIHRIALKNNLLYSAFLIPNLSLEIGVAPQWSVDLYFSYDPLKRNGSYIKHFMSQIELRFWPRHQFEHHFFGVHFLGAAYNVSGGLPYGIKVNDLTKHSYDGTLLGGGFSYGYHIPIGIRWSIEMTLGVGYARINYDRYDCGFCGEKLNSDSKNYFGPTRMGVNLIYIIR